MTCEQHLQDKMRPRTHSLEDADHRLDQILTTLAHELSNPLAAVAYSAELLRRRDITPEVRERASTIILEQTDFMRRLVEDISDLRGTRRGDLGFRKTLTDLAEVARLAVGISRPLIERLGHALEIVTPQSPTRAQGDVARLIRVVSNLLINAARYTP